MAKRLVLWKTQVQVNHKPAQETQVYLHNTHKKKKKINRGMRMGNGKSLFPITCKPDNSQLDLACTTTLTTNHMSSNMEKECRIMQHTTMAKMRLAKFFSVSIGSCR